MTQVTTNPKMVIATIKSKIEKGELSAQWLSIVERSEMSLSKRLKERERNNLHKDFFSVDTELDTIILKTLITEKYNNYLECLNATINRQILAIANSRNSGKSISQSLVEIKKLQDKNNNMFGQLQLILAIG